MASRALRVAAQRSLLRPLLSKPIQEKRTRLISRTVVTAAPLVATKHPFGGRADRATVTTMTTVTTARSPSFAPRPYDRFAFLEDDDAAGSGSGHPPPARFLEPPENSGLWRREAIAGKRLLAFTVASATR